MAAKDWLMKEAMNSKKKKPANKDDNAYGDPKKNMMAKKMFAARKGGK